MDLGIKSILASCAVGVFVLSSTSLSMAQSFNPLMSCETVYSILDADSEGANTSIVGIWSFGFFSGKSDLSHSFSSDLIPKLLSAIRGHCTASTQTYQHAASAFVDSQMDKRPENEDDGQEIIMGFLEPGADLQKLTSDLAPREQDIVAIFKEPLASQLVPYLENLYANGFIAPNPGQTRALSTFTTTSKLINKDPVIRNFPGGYVDILQFLKPDITVAQFRYVEPGNTQGMAFDGLYFVNERWVFIPKAWRALR